MRTTELVECIEIELAAVQQEYELGLINTREYTNASKQLLFRLERLKHSRSSRGQRKLKHTVTAWAMLLTLAGASQACMGGARTDGDYYVCATHNLKCETSADQLGMAANGAEQLYGMDAMPGNVDFFVRIQTGAQDDIIEDVGMGLAIALPVGDAKCPWVYEAKSTNPLHALMHVIAYGKGDMDLQHTAEAWKGEQDMLNTLHAIDANCR